MYMDYKSRLFSEVAIGSKGLLRWPAMLPKCCLLHVDLGQPSKYFILLAYINDIAIYLDKYLPWYLIR
jgi:hypothetical protein